MEKISYAQNQEDILLSLALQDVRQGFYVDIGASHPDIDSVTKYFYDRGWSGINVEPTQKSFNEFLEHRPKDINIRVAVGSKQESTEVYLSSIPGRHSLIHQNADYLGPSHHSETVEMRTLASLLETHLPRNQVIHFLKIDVEGFEKEVLLGLNLNLYRPWIFVIESLNPITLEDESESWESLIINSDYYFVHFDGLNRYYLEKNQIHRKKHLQRVNVLLSDFIPSSLEAVNKQISSLSIHMVSLEAGLLSSQSRVLELEAGLLSSQSRVLELGFTQEKYDWIVNSKTFRYTKHLRKVYFELYFFISRNNSNYVKLVRVSQFLKRFPRLRNKFIRIYLLVNSARRKFALLKSRRSTQQLDGDSAIEEANQKSMARSFRLISEEY